MIEVIYKEDKEDQGTVQEPFSMPRNVRQIGLANGDYRIYIEDYVYTFLCSLAEDGETESQGNVAVLTGEIQWTTDMTCIYVKGALAADGMEATAEHIDFSEKIWQKIQDDKEQYFQEQEIVGWFFAQPQIAIEVTELLVKVHLRHFGGEKILMLMDPGEREDAFFRYDGGTMAKLTGYIFRKCICRQLLIYRCCIILSNSFLKQFRQIHTAYQFILSFLIHDSSSIYQRTYK